MPLTPHLRTWLRLPLAGSLAAAFAGCALSPGQYLGVVPAGQPDPEWGRLRPNQSLNTDTAPYSADVSSRADIYAINPTTLGELAEKRRQRLDAETQSAVPGLLPAADDSPWQYKVGPQDVLQVTVWNHPELSNPTATANELSGRIVNADGTFFYPYVGKVKAQGRTVMAIRDELARRLATYLVEPQVDVGVLTYRSQRVHVMGEVDKPGNIPITDVPPTITDFIAQAGGLKETADLRAATLIRGQQEIPLDLYALYYQGDLRQNIRLQTGDVINIPENRYNKVFVLGEVSKPQSIILPRGRYSLAEAVSDAQGFNPLSSNAGNLYVIRASGSEDVRPQIWHLDASSPDAMILADAFSLEPRDVVYVDPAAVTRWSRVVNSILPSATFIERVVTP